MNKIIKRTLLSLGTLGLVTGSIVGASAVAHNLNNTQQKSADSIAANTARYSHIANPKSSLGYNDSAPQAQTLADLLASGKVDAKTLTLAAQSIQTVKKVYFEQDFSYENKYKIYASNFTDYTVKTLNDSIFASEKYAQSITPQPLDMKFTYLIQDTTTGQMYNQWSGSVFNGSIESIQYKIFLYSETLNTYISDYSITFTPPTKDTRPLLIGGNTHAEGYYAFANINTTADEIIHQVLTSLKRQYKPAYSSDTLLVPDGDIDANWHNFMTINGPSQDLPSQIGTYSVNLQNIKLVATAPAPDSSDKIVNTIATGLSFKNITLTLYKSSDFMDEVKNQADITQEMLNGYTAHLNQGDADWILVDKVRAIFQMFNQNPEYSSSIDATIATIQVLGIDTTNPDSTTRTATVILNRPAIFLGVNNTEALLGSDNSILSLVFKLNYTVAAVTDDNRLYLDNNPTLKSENSVWQFFHYPEAKFGNDPDHSFNFDSVTMYPNSEYNTNKTTYTNINQTELYKQWSPEFGNLTFSRYIQLMLYFHSGVGEFNPDQTVNWMDPYFFTQYTVTDPDEVQVELSANIDGSFTQTQASFAPNYNTQDFEGRSGMVADLARIFATGKSINVGTFYSISHTTNGNWTFNEGNDLWTVQQLSVSDMWLMFNTGLTLLAGSVGILDSVIDAFSIESSAILTETEQLESTLVDGEVTKDELLDEEANTLREDPYQTINGDTEAQYEENLAEMNAAEENQGNVSQEDVNPAQRARTFLNDKLDAIDQLLDSGQLTEEELENVLNEKANYESSFQLWSQGNTGSEEFEGFMTKQMEDFEAWTQDPQCNKFAKWIGEVDFWKWLDTYNMDHWSDFYDTCNNDPDILGSLSDNGVNIFDYVASNYQ